MIERRRLIVLPDTRWGHCNIKSLNLIRVYSRRRPRRNRRLRSGFPPRRRGDGVLEFQTAPAQDGILRTCPADERILPGVTRAHFIMLAKECGVPVDETAFTLEEAYDADELLVTVQARTAFRLRTRGKTVCGRDEPLLRKLQQHTRVFFTTARTARERIGRTL